MPRYRVAAGSRLSVKARSRIHDTTTVWDSIDGEVEVDPDTVATTAVARVAVGVDMTKFDAGDFLKNRKLRKDFALEAHPLASFALTGLTGVVRSGATFTATARGVLDWRGVQIELVLAGRGTLDDMRVEASATFELDIRRLGLSAPRFLMFKVEDEVTVDVAIRGTVVT